MPSIYFNYPLRILMRHHVQGKDIDAWLQPFPRVVSWMAAVRDDTLPVYDDVHVVMNRAAEHSKQRSAAASSKF